MGLGIRERKPTERQMSDMVVADKTKRDQVR